MQAAQGVSFGPYHLAGPQGPLLRKSLLVKLPPKALALLWELMMRAGQVVTKEKLLATVWAETVVGEDTLTAFMGILRRALKDDPRQPRYIATVHRIGYRFIAPLTAPLHTGLESRVQSPESERQKADPSLQTLDSRRQTLDVPLVGREAELSQLHNLFAKALTGQRQIVFVTGEAGIGKTSLIDTFLSEVQSHEEFGVEETEASQKAKRKSLS